MTTSLIMDAIVAALLGAMIWHAIRLNGKLTALRSDSDRMERLVAGLQAASTQAEVAVANLKAAAADAGKSLQAAMDRAEGLKSDLGLITERADKAADRLDAASHSGREAPSSTRTPPRAKPAAEQPRRPPAPEPAFEDDREAQGRLAALLRQAEREAEIPPPRLRTRTPSPVSDSRGSGPVIIPGPSPSPSRAERELQNALKERK